ncbi:MAG: hypothetical protein QNI88_19565 [Desulfobacterales bacterium]|nr:hypothetical protein [Desulfobacterales bacterium]
MKLSEREILRIVTVIYCFMVFAFATSEIESGDTFWQLQTGRHIVDTGSIIRQDVFTLTHDRPRIEHCWLHDVLFYQLYRINGYHAICFFKGLLVAAMAFALLLAADATGASKSYALAISIPAVVLTEWAWLARPQLWSFLLFAVFLLVIERYRSKKLNNALFILVPLMILWCNLHAGAILAFPVLGAYLVGEGIDLGLKRSQLSSAAFKKLMGLFILIIAATVITPYGPYVIKSLFSHVLSPKTGNLGAAALRNLDWKRITFQEFPIFYYAIGLTGFILLINWKRVAVSHLILLAGLAYMGINQGRQIVLFFFGISALLPMYVEIAFRRLLGKMNPKPRLIVTSVGVTCLCVVISLLSMNAFEKKGLFNSGLKAWQFPTQAASFVKAQTLPANIYNSYEWGGYLAWRLFPAYKVFWDARNTSQKTMRDGAQIANGDSGWFEHLDRYGVQTLVILPCMLHDGRRFEIIDRLLETTAFSLVYADSNALVFVRNESVSREWLRDHKLPPNRIYETILSLTREIADADPRQYIPYFEMFRAYNALGEHQKALHSLGTYLQLNPEKDPVGENVYRAYSQAIAQSQGQK